VKVNLAKAKYHMYTTESKENQTFQSRFSFPEQIQEEYQAQARALWNRRERKSERKQRTNI